MLIHAISIFRRLKFDKQGFEGIQTLSTLAEKLFLLGMYYLQKFPFSRNRITPLMEVWVILSIYYLYYCGFMSKCFINILMMPWGYSNNFSHCHRIGHKASHAILCSFYFFFKIPESPHGAQRDSQALKGSFMTSQDGFLSLFTHILRYPTSIVSILLPL